MQINWRNEMTTVNNRLTVKQRTLSKKQKENIAKQKKEMGLFFVAPKLTEADFYEKDKWDRIKSRKRNISQGSICKEQ